MNLEQFLAYAEAVAVSAFEKTVVAVLKHIVRNGVDAAAPVANVVPADEPAPAVDAAPIAAAPIAEGEQNA